MNSIAVAILNWNGKELLEKFLPSVVSTSGKADIIVIDNASTDASLSFLKEHYPDIRIIPLEENYGFAGGYNKGIEQIDNAFIILLNSDVETTGNWIDPLREALQNDGKLAAVQPKIRALNARDEFEYAGASGGYIDHLGYPFCRGRIFDHCEKDLSQYDDFREIFWATGACLAVRREAFVAAGGFDERYFAHMEEIDLCWRMKRLAWKVAVEPKSTVYHLGGGTLSAQNTRKTFLNFRNNLLLLTANLPQDKIFPVIMRRLILDGLAGVQYLLKFSPSHTWAIIRAHFAYYSMMGDVLKQRRGSFPWPLTGVYRRSIIRDYFLAKKRTFNQLDQDSFTGSKTSQNS